jgi:hypothetical protein
MPNSCALRASRVMSSRLVCVNPTAMAFDDGVLRAANFMSSRRSSMVSDGASPVLPQIVYPSRSGKM